MAGASSNTADGMRKSGGEFVHTLQDTTAYMKNLKAEMDNLRPYWGGQAAPIFYSTMDKWGAEFDKISFHLDAMADMLLGGAGNVEKAEDLAIQQGHFFK